MADKLTEIIPRRNQTNTIYTPDCILYKVFKFPNRIPMQWKSKNGFRVLFTGKFVGRRNTRLLQIQISRKKGTSSQFQNRSQKLFTTDKMREKKVISHDRNH